MDPEDEPLTLGAAYYANERLFEFYQKHRPKEKKEVRDLTHIAGPPC